MAEALLEAEQQLEIEELKEENDGVIPVMLRLKERAEAVLNSQGLALSDAVNVFLGHVVSERGMPAGLPHPPLSLDVMTPEQLVAELGKGMDDINAGRTIPWEDVKAEFERDYGIKI